MTDSRVFHRVLPNGMKMLLLEDHSAPLASSWVFYRVGSRNELPGKTGISHWVEHMQFKGTPSIAKGQIFRDVSRHGGVLNALTSMDWTAYYETLPVEQLDLALRIESDRMANSLFDAAETELERTVILSEQQGAENNPGYLLYEEVAGVAFRAHPYGHMVIGFQEDLRSITRDDLYGYYRQYYHPGNAFMVVAGDFSAPELADRIASYFGDIPRGPEAPAVTAREPESRAERRVTLVHPTPAASVRMVYRAPAINDPDFAPLVVADAVLSGGKGMGFGGGGTMGRSSRLYRALVGSGLARSAGSGIGLHIDPHLFELSAGALPGNNPEPLELLLNQEVERLTSEPVPEEELTRAIKQITAQQVYSSEGVTNQAFWLGLMETVDDHGRAERFLPDLQRVTADDIQRAAAKWLIPRNRTTGVLIPTEMNGAESEPVATTAAVMDFASRHDVCWFSRPESDQSRVRNPFEETRLPNNVHVLGQARPESESVSVRFRLGSGAIDDPEGKSGLATFTARTLARGAGARSYEDINTFTDNLGASISVDPGRYGTEIGIRSLRDDLPAMLQLAGEILDQPLFPPEELEKVRNEIVAGIRQADNDTRSTAERLLRQQLFPTPHPLGRRASGDLDSVPGLSRDDVVHFHETRLMNAQITVAIAGGIAEFDAGVELVSRVFGNRAVALLTEPVIPQPPAIDSFEQERTAIPGKSQVDFAMGTTTIPRHHPDYYALDALNLILGRLGLMGRLGSNVRDKQGLAYYSYSSVDAGKDLSIWAARAGVSPENVERAINAIRSELRQIRDDGVTSEELSDARDYLTGILPLALESNDGAAATLMNIAYHDLGLDYLDRYPAIVRGLSADDLARGAAYLDPERLVVGIAGPPRE